jgi:cardiolipin synthase
MKNLPNYLTFLRIVLIVPILGLMLWQQDWASWTALGLYTVAAITDFFDGYLAREMNVSSAVGRFLDPIADKLLVMAVLVVLAALGRLEGLWIVPALAIVLREVFISGLREFLGPMNVTLPVSNLAKWKTTFQMFCLGFLMMADVDVYDWPLLAIGHALLSLAAVLSIITGWRYAVEGMKIILKS